MKEIIASKSTPKNLNIELARTVAMIFVVMEHVLSGLIFSSNSAQNWYLGIFIWSAIKINVPIFFIISAFLSFNDSLIPHKFFLNRIKRVIIPIVFWGAFYYLIFHYSDINLRSMAASILNGTSMYHLYFMYWFIGFSFFFPFVNYLYFKSQKSFYFYFFVLIFACSLFPFINLMFNTSINVFSVTGISSFGFLVFYAFVPKLSEKIKEYINTKKKWRVFFVLYVISCFLTFTVSFILHKINQTPFPSVINGSSIFIFLSAIMFYSFITSINLSLISSKVERIISFMGGNSFGIYLIHPLILGVISHIIQRYDLHPYFFSNDLHKIIYLTSMTCIVYIFSMLIYLFMKKNKYLSKMIC